MKIRVKIFKDEIIFVYPLKIDDQHICFCYKNEGINSHEELKASWLAQLKTADANHHQDAFKSFLSSLPKKERKNLAIKGQTNESI